MAAQPLSSLYAYEDYKKYVNDWIESRPQQGYGEYRKISKFLRVSSTMVSQIFKGDKHLSLEMAAEMASYLDLNSDETSYFFLTVQYQKAGSIKLQKTLHDRIKEIQEKVKELENRVKKTKKSDTVSPEVMNAYYSSWMHSGILNLIGINQFNNVEEVSKRLFLPTSTVKKVIEFLVENEMISRDEKGLQVTNSHIFTGKRNAAQATRHHSNWRNQAINKMSTDDSDSHFFFTAPMSLSEELATKIRNELPEFIERILKQVGPSNSEVVRCLNIDWFEY